MCLWGLLTINNERSEHSADNRSDPTLPARLLRVMVPLLNLGLDRDEDGGGDGRWNTVGGSIGQGDITQPKQEDADLLLYEGRWEEIRG